VIAIDVDLGKVTATKDSEVLYDRSDMTTLHMMPDDEIILCEIAGPVMHSPNGRDACPPGKRKWMIYNAAWIGMLVGRRSPKATTLVATSTAWTHGYDLGKRHAVAGMIPLKHTKAGNPVYKYPKDIRETFAMQYFYRLDPKVWVPLHSYLENL